MIILAGLTGMDFNNKEVIRRTDEWDYVDLKSFFAAKEQQQHSEGTAC